MLSKLFLQTNGSNKHRSAFTESIIIDLGYVISSKLEVFCYSALRVGGTLPQMVPFLRQCSFLIRVVFFESSDVS